MEYGETEVLGIKENCGGRLVFTQHLSFIIPSEKTKLVSFYMYFKG